MTQTLSPRSLTLLAGTSALALLLLGQPAQAHQLVGGGLASGFLHPISGADHLLLLIAVGAAASQLSSQLLLWALAGAVAGGVAGALGASIPGLELLAALAIAAVAVLSLRSVRSPQAAPQALGAGLVASAVASHAMLHGLEAPSEGAALGWWLGALTASVLVSGGSFLALRRMSQTWTRALALLLALSGGVASLGALGLLAR
jgi:urease accessory protein